MTLPSFIRTLSKPTLGWMIIFLLGFGSLLLRIPQLTNSFWLDEAAQALESARPLAEQHRIAWDFHPPLFHYLTHFLFILGKAEWWLRLTSLIAGVGTVIVVFLIARAQSSVKTAIVSALLLSISSFHIYYSQELRPYALATFFATLSWFFLLRFCKQSSPKLFFWYTLTTILGLYTMYLYPFLLLSQLLFIAIAHKTHIKRILLSSVVSGIAFLPWLPFFVEQLQVGMGWAANVAGWSSVVGTPQFKALPLVLLKFLIGPVEFSALGVEKYLVVIPLMATLFLSGLAIKKYPKNFWIFWLFVPIGLSWLLSFMLPVIQPKRVLLSLPAFFILLSMGLDEISKRAPVLYRVLLVIILGTNILTTTLYYKYSTYQRENWREAVTWVEEDCMGSNCMMLFAFDAPFAPWRWYASSLIPSAHLDSIQLRDESQALELISQTSGKTKVYMFDYLQDITDPRRVIHEKLLSAGFKEITAYDGGNLGFVRVFSTTD